MEPVGLKSHMLIRVGLNVGEGEWFGRRTDFSSYRKADEAAGNIAGPGGRRTAGEDLEPDALPRKKRERKKSGGFWRHILKFPTRYPGERRGEREGEKRAHRKRENGKWEQRKRENEKREQRKSRKQESRDAAELRRLRAEWEESIRNIEREILKIASEIPELAGEESRCYAVYEDSVRKVLLRAEEDAAVDRDALMEREFSGAGMLQESAPGRYILPALWQRHMDFEEFSDYRKSFWVEMLMPKAVLFHYVILGAAPCIPELAEKYAGRMKSLKWVLSENECSPELMEFVEEFYIEYGLAISLQVLSSESEWKRLGMLCGVPSNILDFTGDSRTNAARAAEGSIWLDFGSVEEKKRRIEGRCPGVAYFSLKDKWRRAQRRCQEPLLP